MSTASQTLGPASLEVCAEIYSFQVLPKSKASISTQTESLDTWELLEEKPEPEPKKPIQLPISQNKKKIKMPQMKKILVKVNSCHEIMSPGLPRPSLKVVKPERLGLQPMEHLQIP